MPSGIWFNVIHLKSRPKRMHVLFFLLLPFQEGWILGPKVLVDLVLNPLMSAMSAQLSTTFSHFQPPKKIFQSASFTLSLTKKIRSLFSATTCHLGLPGRVGAFQRTWTRLALRLPGPQMRPLDAEAPCWPHQPEQGPRASRAQTMTPWWAFGMGLGRVGLPQKHWEWKHAEDEIWKISFFLGQSLDGEMIFQVPGDSSHGGLVALSSHTPAETWLLVPAMRLLPLCICPTYCFSWQERFYWLANVKIPIFTGRFANRTANREPNRANRKPPRNRQLGNRTEPNR